MWAVVSGGGVEGMGGCMGIGRGSKGGGRVGVGAGGRKLGWGHGFGLKEWVRFQQSWRALACHSAH